MEIPESMRAELAAWSGGRGIDLESWVGCEGRFALAVGYAAVFWPEFEQVGGYVLRKGSTPEMIKGFEQQPGATRQSVEWVLNHLHLLDLQYGNCPDASPDKLLALGNTLAEIYRAKLA